MLLSDQIGAFRRRFGGYVDDGLTLSAESVEALDDLLASFQAQARLLESGGPTPLTFDDACRTAADEARAISALAKRLQATAEKLRSSEAAFRPRERV